MGLPAKYGGFETFAHFLVLHLADKFDLTVYCSGPDYRERPKWLLGARLLYLPFRANGPQSLVFDSISILHACFFSDILLILGSPGGMLYHIARLLGKKVILNQGGLDWQRSKWGPNTQKLLKYLERSSVIGADIVVCDNAGIGDYFRQSYGRESHLIEYGGDQVSVPSMTEEFKQTYPFTTQNYAFAVARIQPDNNIEMILEGFAHTPKQSFIFIGNWAGSIFGKQIKNKFQTFPNIHLLEAIYDPDTLNRFRAYCSIYVHGHSAGGTNPSLVEAMHLGLPILAFDVVYNRATTEEKALFFKNAAELSSLILSTPKPTWDDQRPIMVEIANRRYTWEIIANKYSQLFQAAGKVEGS